MRVIDLIEVLEKEYPNDALLLTKLSEKERDIYIAKLELIGHIKMIEKDV